MTALLVLGAADPPPAFALFQCPVDHSLFLPKTVTLDPAGSQGKEARPTALGIAPQLVNQKIKGFVSTKGTSDTAPGQVYPFTLDAPVPPRIDAAWTGLVVQVGTAGGQPFVQGLSGGSSLPKSFGLQGVHVEPQLTFVTVAARYTQGSQLAPSHFLSVVDTVSDVHNPASDEMDLALLDPDDPNDPNDDFSGEVPEGVASVVSISGGQRRRTVLAQAYHEGTLVLVDWTTVTNVHVAQEVPIDLDFFQWPNTSYLGLDPSVDPEGNLNRAVAVATSVGSGPNQGKTLVFATLNFDPCPVLDDGDPSTPQNCTHPDSDENPDEGPYDYVVTLDFTNYPVSGGVHQLAQIGHTRLFSSPYADRGTVCVLALNGDQDRLYVLSKNQGPHAGFGQGSGGETAWLYVLDITQGPPHPITFSQPLHLVLGLQKGDLRPTAGHAVFVHNPNLTTGAVDRLYVPTEAPQGANNPVPTNDGVLVVLDVTNKDAPSCLKLIKMDDGDSGKKRNVTDLAALPVTTRFLGNALARNVLLATMHEVGSSPPDTGHLALVEDR